MGKWRLPRPVNRHASIKAAGYWGPWHSALALRLLLEAKPERGLGPGASRRSRNGGPQTCLPAAHGVGLPVAWYGSASTSTTPDPREADDIKTSTGAASLGWLPRSGDIYAKGTSRGAHDVRRDDQGQAGASGRRVPVASLVLKGKRRRGVRGIRQRFPYRCNKTMTSRTAGQRSSWSPGRRHHQSFVQAKTTFVRVASTSCPPSN